MSTTTVTRVLEKRVQELVEVHGSYRKLGKLLGYDHAGVQASDGSKVE